MENHHLTYIKPKYNRFSLLKKQYLSMTYILIVERKFELKMNIYIELPKQNFLLVHPVEYP